MRGIRLLVAFVALVAVPVVLGAGACQRSTDPIATDTVRRATVHEIVDVPASVTARAVATLTAPADGTLARLAVQPGTGVAAGAVVAVIDSPAARKRLADATLALSAASRGGSRPRSVDLSGAQRRLDQAAAEAFTTARAATEKIADETVRAALLAQIDAAQLQYESAAAASRSLITQVQRGIAGIGEAVAALGAAQRAQAQAAFDLAKATVDALTMRAPIAGVVQFARPVAAPADPLADLLGSLSAGSPVGAAGVAAGAGVAGVDDVLAVGDPVGAGTPVVTIIDASEIGLAGEVDETDVLLVSPGIAAEVELDAAPGLRYRAAVRSVDLLPTPSARGGVAYRIRLAFIDLEPAGPSAPPARQPGSSAASASPGASAASASPGTTRPPTPRPGMSAVAHLLVRTATEAVAVPAAAVFTTADGEAVWLVRAGRAVRQVVRVGVQGADLVEVVSGLEPGQRVVVRGTDRVTAGQKL